jgi:hypothetical protein
MIETVHRKGPSEYEPLPYLMTEVNPVFRMLDTLNIYKTVDNVKHNTCVTLYIVLPSVVKVKMSVYLIQHHH